MSLSDLGNKLKSVLPSSSDVSNKLSSGFSSLETTAINSVNNIKKDIGSGINTAENYAGSAVSDIKHVGLDVVELSPFGLAYNAYKGNLTNMQAYTDIKSIEADLIPPDVKDAIGMGTLLAIGAGGLILYYAYQNRETILSTLETTAKTGVNAVGKTYVPGFSGFQ